jgi:hypothetical protein
VVESLTAWTAALDETEPRKTRQKPVGEEMDGRTTYHADKLLVRAVAFFVIT